MITVPLTNSSHLAIVDDEDGPRVLERSWRLRNKGGYVVTGIPYADGRRNGAGKIQYTNLGLHRFVLGLKPGDPQEVDIRDGNPLNCRRSNLRVADRSTIGMKRKPQEGGTSKYRGVFWDQHKRYWQAVIKVDGEKHYLGSFADEESAGVAAETFLKEQIR